MRNNNELRSAECGLLTRHPESIMSNPKSTVRNPKFGNPQSKISNPQSKDA